MTDKHIPVTINIRREGEVTLPIRGYANPDDIKENRIINDLGKVVFKIKGDKIKGGCKIKNVQRLVERGVLVRLEVDADDINFSNYQKI